MERKLKRFNILLDDESLLYFPGSFLTGKVLLELEENTPATDLYFHIIGEGVVRLANSPSSGKGKSKVVSERENYIDFRMRLLGDGATNSEVEADDEVDSIVATSSTSRDSNTHQQQQPLSSNKILVLSPGVHTFPFKLGLPPHLPSTFLGLHGWVQYFCRAVLRESSGLVHKNQQVFIIINPIDLNNEPQQLQQPFYCEAEEKVRTGCLASVASTGKSAGLISCRVRLDRGGFVPGECIQVSATIENNSAQILRGSRAVLTETVEYRVGKSPPNNIIQAETRELASVERGKILARSSEHWKRELLYIPALPPTNLRGCHLIKIHYDVYFEILTKNAKKPIKLQLPIVMATYPVRNKDGTLKRRKGASYPDNLPVFRPWLDEQRQLKK